MPVDLLKHQRFFFERAQEDIEKVLTILDAFKKDKTGLLQGEDVEKLRFVYRCFHSMKGTSGMLQLSEIRDVVRPVADQLEEIISSGAFPDSTLLGEIETAAKDILNLIPPPP